MRGGSAGIAQLPAAGMPWFMTVFGRDTLITSYQTLLLGQDLARGALDVLAELQATEDDPSIDAEPGKIVHEVRHGKAAKAWFQRYYGTVDATPLYLVLLSEVWRWTGTTRSSTACASRRCGRSAGSSWRWRRVHLLQAPDRARPREPVVEGLGRLAAFRRRTFALPPIAPVEVQGYAYDAMRRTAELAREVWGDAGLAERLERDAADLQRRFDEAYWTGARRTTRSRSTATARGSTRCARTSAICSGAGSSPTSGWTRWWRP